MASREWIEGQYQALLAEATREHQRTARRIVELGYWREQKLRELYQKEEDE